MPIANFNNTNLFIKWLNRILTIFCFIAVISLIIEYSFYLDKTWNIAIKYFNIFFIHFYLLQFLIKLFLSENSGKFIKEHWLESIIAFIILIETVVLIRFSFFHQYTKNINLGIQLNVAMRLYIIFTQILVFFAFIPEFIKYNKIFSNLKFHPSKIIIFSFIVLIILGTLFLLFPKSVNSSDSISLIDAIFTSTSSVCVTGLTVVDISTYFTKLGQIIILILIQIGGIGTITTASFLAILFGKGVGFRERVILNDVLSTDNFSLITTLLKRIILTTFVIEGIGALSLFFIWNNNNWSIWQLIFNSIFHSISAFCNAGFSVFSNSLMDYNLNVGVNIIFIILIVLGGLGFIVLMDVFGYIKSFFIKSEKKYLKLHTKIVLISSVILLIIGILCFLIFENKYTQEKGFFNSLLTGTFLSVTSRTAGFNTIDTSSLSVPMTLVVMFLMFIGASPGSTGGGIKTATFAVLWIGILSIIRGKREIVVFRKNIPFYIFNRAIIIISIFLASQFFAYVILSFLENFSFLDICFEAASGLGTVGLTRGITPNISFFSKIIIILLMLVGRVGILTLTFAITSGYEKNVKLKYPTGSINVG